jgi:ribosomal protein S18 acetylase RimI-like enzyme
MIRKLAFDTNEQALELLQLQMSAYRVEAELIGFTEIPPLKDSISSVRESKERFYGWYEGDELAGAVSFETDGDEATICRMMVQPNHFRKGVASSLLQHVLELLGKARRINVSTGAKNEPAVRLYRKHGFHEQSRRIVGPDVELITFVKEKQAPRRSNR